MIYLLIFFGFLSISTNERRLFFLFDLRWAFACFLAFNLCLLACFLRFERALTFLADFRCFFTARFARFFDFLTAFFNKPPACLTAAPFAFVADLRTDLRATFFDETFFLDATFDLTLTDDFAFLALRDFLCERCLRARLPPLRPLRPAFLAFLDFLLGFDSDSNKARFLDERLAAFFPAFFAFLADFFFPLDALANALAPAPLATDLALVFFDDFDVFFLTVFFDATFDFTLTEDFPLDFFFWTTLNFH